jgi:glucokinase
MSVHKVLCADIGGTNSRFGFFETDLRDSLALAGSKWFRTEDAGSFGRLLAMLSDSDFPLKPADADIAVIAIAGPVEGGVRSSPPLIPWDIDITNAEADYGFRRSVLINDFVAQAYASRSHPGKSAQEILPGRIFPDGTVAVIGAGTGLGKAALVPDGTGGYSAMASEGAHANFAFVSREETRFQEFLMRELDEEYITANTVVSGKGLSLIHQFLTGEKLDPGDVLPMRAGTCKTVEWAARFYGRACRNFALETLARGGLYIAGGVAAKSPVLVTHGSFAREFRSSRTMSAILSRIPVFLITNEESGLWGAAVLGRQLLRRKGIPLS